MSTSDADPVVAGTAGTSETNGQRPLESDLHDEIQEKLKAKEKEVDVALAKKTKEIMDE